MIVWKSTHDKVVVKNTKLTLENNTLKVEINKIKAQLKRAVKNDSRGPKGRYKKVK